MDIAIVGRHTKVSDDLRLKIADRMDKIAQLAPKATRADVHVVHERNPRHSGDSERVEITVYGRAVVRAEASADDRVAALDMATAKVIERIRKLHSRMATRHQGKLPLHAVAGAPEVAPAEAAEDTAVANVETWEGAPDSSVREIPLDGTPIVIRSKVHSAVPMTVTEAIDQMELVGHDFFLFLDAETRCPSAVYRRRGWTYGVIQLEEAAAQTARDIA